MPNEKMCQWLVIFLRNVTHFFFSFFSCSWTIMPSLSRVLEMANNFFFFHLIDEKVFTNWKEWEIDSYVTFCFQNRESRIARLFDGCVKQTKKKKTFRVLCQVGREREERRINNTEQIIVYDLWNVRKANEFLISQ